MAANIEAIASQLQRLPPDTVVDGIGPAPHAALDAEQPTLTDQMLPPSILQAGPQQTETVSIPTPPVPLIAAGPRPMDRRWWLWAASAAAVVLILTVLGTLLAGSDDPATDVVALLGDNSRADGGLDSLSSTTTTARVATAVSVSRTPDPQTVISTTTVATSSVPTTPATTKQVPATTALVTASSVSTTASTVTTVATTQAPTTAAPTTPTSSCHPAYSPCLPFFPGDALNCGDLLASQKPVTVHDPAVDPYGLDSNNDGVGCESG